MFTEFETGFPVLFHSTFHYEARMLLVPGCFGWFQRSGVCGKDRLSRTAPACLPISAFFDQNKLELLRWAARAEQCDLGLCMSNLRPRACKARPALAASRLPNRVKGSNFTAASFIASAGTDTRRITPRLVRARNSGFRVRAETAKTGSISPAGYLSRSVTMCARNIGARSAKSPSGYLVAQSDPV